MKSTFKIGDNVRIIHPGRRYTTYSEKFKFFGFQNIEENDAVDFSGPWVVFNHPAPHDIDDVILVPIENARGEQLLINEFGLTLWEEDFPLSSKSSAGISHDTIPLESVAGILEKFDIKITYSYPGCSLKFENTPLRKLGSNRVHGLIDHLKAKNPNHDLLPILLEYEEVRRTLKQIKTFILQHGI